MSIATDVVQLKTERANSQAIQDWRSRMDAVGDLYSGDVSVRFRDETTRRSELQIANTVQLGMDDISRLVSESIGTVRCTPRKNTDSEKEAANVRENVARTYWDYGAGKILEPRLAMDLAGTGAAFLLCFADKASSDYPKPLRLSPRNCFPDLGMLGQQFAIGTDPGIIDTELHDLIVVTKLPARTVNRLYGTNVGDNARMASVEAEVIDYYDPDIMIKVVQGLQNGKVTGDPQVIQQAPNPLGRVPVAFAQMDTYDGSFRGVFDQIGPIMKVLNRLYTLTLDDADRRIYSQPVFTPDIDESTYGIAGKPIVAESVEAAAAVKLLQPDSASPSLFPLLSQLERFMHVGAGYPEQRSGEVGQSIASATFVSATLGVLTSQVKNLGRLLAFMREQWNSMAFSLDEKVLNFEKPLSRPVKNKYVYLPGKDLNGVWSTRVTYSPGAGINELNERVGALQALGAGVVSKETVREQLKEIEDPLSEQQKIDYEQAADFFLKQVLPTLPPQIYAKALLLMGEGKTMREVYDLISKTPAPAEPGTPTAPEAPVSPEQVQAEQTSLQKGGVPGEAPAAPAAPTPEFTPPPLTNVQVRPY